MPAIRTAHSEIARRSRGTPRIANRLLRRVRDYAEVQAQTGTITFAVARAAMEMLKVDAEGFDELDRRLLGIPSSRSFDGGPVGVESLAAALSPRSAARSKTWSSRYLIQQGFLVRTARGRMVTRQGVATPGPEAAAAAAMAGDLFAGDGNV